MPPTKFLPLLWLALLILVSPAFAGIPVASEPVPKSAPGNRVASLFISQSFLNEQLRLHLKSELLQKLALTLDPEHDQMLLRGEIQVPIEELRAINLDPKLGRFRFQVALRLRTTKHGHLILEFPLDETYFYPADSKDSAHERVIVPVQLLSLGLASARGYLAALSGDFAGFDRRTAKLDALLKTIDQAMKREKNAEAREDLKTQRESLRLQLAAVPIERKQLKTMSKEVEAILGFTGEKEISLNEELAASKNSLILKIKLSQLAPYLTGVELGGVRIVHNKRDGNGEDYLVIDINSELTMKDPPPIVAKPSNRPGMKTAPALVMRLNQSLFESEAVVSAEQKEMGSKLKDFDLQLKEDGLHVSGRWKVFLFISVAFDTIVDFELTGTDEFEVRVRQMSVAGIDFDFLSKFVLETLKKRLNHSLKGICHFKYVGEGDTKTAASGTSDASGTPPDHSRALRVTVDPKALIPAFPDLHLVGVDVREREFHLKIGRP